MSATKKPKRISADDIRLCCIFSVIEHIVIEHDEPVIAKEIAELHGITKSLALKQTKVTGYEVRRMNKFIRGNLKD